MDFGGQSLDKGQQTVLKFTPGPLIKSFDV